MSSITLIFPASAGAMGPSAAGTTPVKGGVATEAVDKSASSQLSINGPCSNVTARNLSSSLFCQSVSFGGGAAGAGAETSCPFVAAEEACFLLFPAGLIGACAGSPALESRLLPLTPLVLLFLNDFCASVLCPSSVTEGALGGGTAAAVMLSDCSATAEPDGEIGPAPDVGIPAAAPDTGVEEECRPPVVVLVVVLLLDVFKVSGVRVGVKAGDGPPVGVEVFVVSLAADVVDAVVLLSAVGFWLRFLFLSFLVSIDNFRFPVSSSPA
jgi:hypothetical protein